VVIISGVRLLLVRVFGRADRFFYQAIRAIRHPERYGPRRNGGNGAGQSRARGLTRAILDTFPIVKFGNNRLEDNNATSAQSVPGKDVETLTDSHTGAPAMELREWEMLDNSGNVSPIPQGVTPGVESKDEAEQVSGDMLKSNSMQAAAASAVNDTAHQTDNLGEGSSRRPAIVATDRKDVTPAAIGRETCPICIMDFEEGDDLRLLPCEGKHRFHQTCVDPWLLELSSSCPICREGEMIAFLSI
jgi:Ring finger domain